MVKKRGVITDKLSKIGLLYENIFCSNTINDRERLLSELSSDTIKKLKEEHERSGLKLNGKAIKLIELEKR